MCAKTNEKHRKERLEDLEAAGIQKHLESTGDKRREGSSEGKGESDHA